jgi:hypothetical protein
VARTKEKRTTTEFWGGSRNSHLVDLGMQGRIILKWSLKKQDCRAWIEFIHLEIDRNVGLL